MRKRGEAEILATLDASITTQEEINEVLIAIASKNQPRHSISIPPPTLEKD